MSSDSWPAGPRRLGVTGSCHVWRTTTLRRSTMDLTPQTMPCYFRRTLKAATCEASTAGFARGKTSGGSRGPSDHSNTRSPISGRGVCHGHPHARLEPRRSSRRGDVRTRRARTGGRTGGSVLHVLVQLVHLWRWCSECGLRERRDVHARRDRDRDTHARGLARWIWHGRIDRCDLGGGRHPGRLAVGLQHVRAGSEFPLHRAVGDGAGMR